MLTQFFVLGLPNLGIDVDTQKIAGWTLLRSQAGGSTLISGGAFGIEASLLTTVVEAALILWLVRRLQTRYCQMLWIGVA